MHSVDPMEIMLSDVFDKVFYNKEQEQSRKVCEECDGWGAIEVDAPRPHGFNRDVGYMDVDKIECPECEGTGELESEQCNCTEAEEPHDHCVGCDCILRWDESENYCQWCEERMEKEAKNVS